MSSTERRIRQLHVRASGHADVHRLALRLEDALRCASLPDRGQQLLLIRRLALGRVDANASAQSLALLLERRVGAVGGSWIDGAALAGGDEAQAHAASAVYFASRWDARLALALRLAQGRACTAWHWRAAVPEYRPHDGVLANLRHIALALAELPEAAAALPAWLARLVEWGAGDALASALPQALGQQLVQRLAATAQAGSSADPQHERLHDAQRSAAPEARGALPAWLQRCVQLAGGHGRNAAGGAGARCAGAGPGAPVPSPGAAQRQPTNAGAAPAPGANDASRAAAPPPAHARAPAPRHGARLADGASNAQADAHRAAVSGARLAPSAAGGLLFLLHPLARLGIAEWCARPGVQGFAERVLAQALQRLRVAPDDPIWQMLTGIADDASLPPAPAPAAWADAPLAPARGSSAPLPAAALAGALTLDAQAGVFLTVARRWLRRVARIGLADLVLRPALLGLGTTHVDLHFRLDDCDLRVRRCGLDLDPGWLPWLGRVVGFHYGAAPAR